MTQYDKISKKYVDAESERPERKFWVDPSFMKAVGEVYGKKVLDLACGAGYFTRLIKNAGAKRVVGVDISKEMINLAEKDPLVGVEYILGDASNLKNIEEFDEVVAGFLLHYAKTKEELFGMCVGAYNNLKNGGKFISLNRNPLFPVAHYPQYGIILEQRKGALQDGVSLNVTILPKNKPPVSFETFHWSKETYEEALSSAGFKEIRWIDLEVSPEGIKEYGSEFWNELLERPYLSIIEAIK